MPYETLGDYLRSLTLDTDQKKIILTLLQSDSDFWLTESGLREASDAQIDELWQWLILSDNDQRHHHLETIKNRHNDQKKKITELQSKLSMQMIHFDEAVDEAWEDDVDSILDQLE